MKKNVLFKLIILAAFLSLFATVSFAADPSQNFPFVFEPDLEKVDKLCYAGHIQGGGMFYDDGFMVTPEVSFSVGSRYGGGENQDLYGGLSMEISLIYENAENTGSVKETVRKYEPGDIQPGRSYPLFSETAVKSLRQRKKLYSSDVMSIKVVMNYQPEAGAGPKKQVTLLYVAKEDEYYDKLSLTESPEE